MEKVRQSDQTSARLHRTLSTPRRALLNMTLFVILIGIIAAVLIPQLQSAILTNPFLNGLTIAVLAVIVLSADRAGLAADALGPARGYRHALLEAGLVGERVYLQATALGLGVCAVGAFYDDEASRLVGVDPAREWVLHFVAVGVPA